MIDIGRYALGDFVCVPVNTTNAAGTRTAPTACPAFRAYNGSGTTAVTGSVPIGDKFRSTGNFLLELFLDARFAAGTWNLSINWAVSGTDFGLEFQFTIDSGGDTRGTPISLYSYEQRDQNTLIWQTDGGMLVRGRGPRV